MNDQKAKAEVSQSSAAREPAELAAGHDDQPATNGNVGRKNFLNITVYQILLRVGWIFKTESAIIPAALDSIGASGWIRGCLPMLNRIGQSLPPLLAWPFIKSARRQKRWLMCTTLLMGLLFCLLGGIWIFGVNQRSS